MLREIDLLAAMELQQAVGHEGKDQRRDDRDRSREKPKDLSDKVKRKTQKPPVAHPFAPVVDPQTGYVAYKQGPCY
jgi:hypothetical protein